MNIKMVQFGEYGAAFLVVDGLAGDPIHAYNDRPIWHPAGYVYFPKKTYSPDVWSGKLFKLVEVEIMEEKVPECEEYKTKYQQATEALKECNHIVYSRYERHPALAQKESTDLT